MLRKKGQGGGTSQAAIVILAVTLILVFYIMFLPPEERADLLEDEDGVSSVGGDGENTTLLNMTALRLEYVGVSDYEHNIPNIYLFERSEASVLEEYTPFYVRNGWFDKKSYEAVFYVKDISNTENVAVAFSAPVAKGKIQIDLNGVRIFEYEVVQPDVGPVELRKELLKEGENVLKLSVDGVGIRFWSTNEYSVEDLQVIADIKDVKQQESLNTFTVTNEEFYNIESAQLQFYPVCNPASIGTLEVRINNKVVYSAVPDCDLLQRQDILPSDLNAGKNTIMFKTSKGSYRIELIEVKTELKDVQTFFDYFEINSSAYYDVLANRKELWLEIQFVDDGERKEAEINVNGHLTYLDQTRPVYRKRISSWAEEGARNYIEIKPQTLLKIVELKVVLEED